MAKTAVSKARPKTIPEEIGVIGIKQFSGYINEEFLRVLAGPKGRKTYREMADNDSIVGAILSAVDLLIRGAEWRVEPVTTSDADKADAEFAKSLMDDMSHTWTSFISEALSMLTYGWSYFEVILKQRLGPYQTDPSRRSKYTDGKIGVRKFAPRAQTTLDHWDLQDDGGINGMHQSDPALNVPSVFIPIERSMLIRTTERLNNPEGRSILRNAYRPWYMLRNIQDVEAVGIERELAGLPLVRIPASVLNSQDPKDMTVRAAYEKIARDLKFNEQGALIIPSDLWQNQDGTPSDKYKVDISLISTSGRRQIDTSNVIIRYQRDIARSALADFIMLGTDGKGSYALSEDKTELFLAACQTFANQICDVLNVHHLPRVFLLNGMQREAYPRYVCGKIAPTDLKALSTFLNVAMAQGAIQADDDLEAHLRSASGLPELNPDTVRRTQPKEVNPAVRTDLDPAAPSAN